jgi:catechol 2,3-dioxygenase-like lactoylglutathione lyase family enzyme
VNPLASEEQTIPPVFHYVSTIEVPVRDLAASAAWYERVLSTEVTWHGEASMLLRMRHAHLQLYLVETSSGERLRFANPKSGVVHSVVDFFSPDLAAAHAALHALGVAVTDLRLHANDRGGFGFDDPDGNRFGVTNVPFATRT